MQVPHLRSHQRRPPATSATDVNPGSVLRQKVPRKDAEISLENRKAFVTRQVVFRLRKGRPFAAKPSRNFTIYVVHRCAPAGTNDRLSAFQIHVLLERPRMRVLV